MFKTDGIPGKRLILLGMMVVWMLRSGAAAAWAGDFEVFRTEETRQIELVVGQTIILKTDTPRRFSRLRVNITDPAVATANVPHSPNEILLTGKSPGTTDMVLWEDKQIVAMYHLVVGYDVAVLKQKLRALLPNETDVKVFSTPDSVTLSGRVSSMEALSLAMSLAKSYAPEENIQNLLQVGGAHQIMLEVKIAEMQRSLGKKLGVNFSYARGSDFALSLLSNMTALDEDISGVSKLLVSPMVNSIFGFSSGDSYWTFFLNMLKENGLVKILAEPTLVALSGQTSTFLVGGEFPVPVPQEADTITIEYKQYGVGLHFTPTVLSDNRINIAVAPDVSEIDFNTAVQFGGFAVPGITTRRASSTVELADGQSFAIAGLLREQVRDVYSRYPVLGDIPILGMLFRSREFQKNETELVIIVTPRIVKPYDGSKQALPTDFYVEPDDTDFYLLGFMEGRASRPYPSEAGKMDGSFGHAIPSPE